MLTSNCAKFSFVERICCKVPSHPGSLQRYPEGHIWCRLLQTCTRNCSWESASCFYKFLGMVSLYSNKLPTKDAQCFSNCLNFFQASGTTYIIISWKDECSSTLYRFESPGKLVHVQTLAVSGHGKDWLAIEQGQEVWRTFKKILVPLCLMDRNFKSFIFQIFLVMAASSEGNACTKQNSVVWKMSNGALSVSTISSSFA